MRPLLKKKQPTSDRTNEVPPPSSSAGCLGPRKFPFDTSFSAIFPRRSALRVQTRGAVPSFAMSALATALAGSRLEVPSRRTSADRRSARSSVPRADEASRPPRVSCRGTARGNLPRPRHVVSAYAPVRPGSSDEECVETKGGDECRSPNARTGDARAAPDLKPILCFVNGKSGGRRGAALMQLLAARDDINAVEIVDLTSEGPSASLRRHVGVVPNLRVLVCGGDGTVAWVLQAMEDLETVRRFNPPEPLARPHPSHE